MFRSRLMQWLSTTVLLFPLLLAACGPPGAGEGTCPTANPRRR